MHAECPSHPGFEELLHGADATGQHQEGVSTGIHHGLPLPHVGGDDQLIGVGVDDFVGHQRLRNDPDRAGSGGFWPIAPAPPCWRCFRHPTRASARAGRSRRPPPGEFQMALVDGRSRRAEHTPTTMWTSRHPFVEPVRQSPLHGAQLPHRNVFLGRMEPDSGPRPEVHRRHAEFGESRHVGPAELGPRLRTRCPEKAATAGDSNPAAPPARRRSPRRRSRRRPRASGPRHRAQNEPGRTGVHRHRAFVRNHVARDPPEIPTADIPSR